jgi:hypothetical protein
MFRLSFIIIIVFSVLISAQSPHGKKFKLDCESCHTTDSWVVNPGEAKFEHNKTSFPLFGQHKSVGCRACHSSLEFSETKSQCFNCHVDMHSNTVGNDCVRCHEPTSWLVRNINVLHQAGRFPLVGKHLNARCEQCHLQYTELKFPPLGIRCFDCHSSDYYSAKSPDHAAGNFSTECQDCHNLNDAQWNMTNFAHSFFPLVGGHNLQTCFSCHKNKNFTGLSKECVTCHQSNYNSAKNPDHISAGFPTKCESCHNINSWQPANFDHNTTKFPLSGKHTNVQCSVCHQNGYANISTDCYSCHKSNYDNSTNPNHVAGGFPTTCNTCHNTNGWTPATFDHSLTKFPLTGTHTTVQCSSCHQNGYTNTSSDCYSCHKSNYDNSTNPNHIAAAFPTDCQTCHTTTGWKPATFDHDGKYFPIYSGSHNGKWSNCSDCHTNSSNYAVFSCITCHDHNQTDTDSKHQGVQGYTYSSSACYSCHPRGSSDGSFNHATSVFPLSGAHTTVSCSNCHTNGYAGTPTTCVSCHQTNYNSTSNPNHTTLALSTDCSTCHTTNTGWKPAQFPIHSNYFTFTGAHSTIAGDCASCHNGNYTNTAKTCVGCHQTNYNGTTNPSHTTLGLSTDCSTCHTTNTGWKPAQFPIHSNYFALTGAHATISSNCATCHNGNYTNTAKTCVGCHQANYNSTTDPNHIAAAFPTDCQTCHTTTAWKPATFDHDGKYFPIYSGSHNGRWSNCSDCHTNNSNYAVFSCITCHEHNQSETDSKHQGVQGYSYTSSACYSCHPRGNSDGSFNHATSVFPLSGAHATVNCSNCHTNGYAGTPTTCVSCHQANYNGTTNPGHTTLGLSTDCSTCHTTKTGWKPAQFSIHNNYFSLTGAHSTMSGDCASCHNGNYTNTAKTCVGCHQANYNGTTNPNHTTLGLSTDCASCHTTNTGWKPAQFPLHSNYFALTGAHAAISSNCATCHNGNYINTSKTCVGCHQSNYNGTTNPSHAAAGFPTDCQSCHTTTGWKPATLDHDGKYFPIYSGSHNGKWSNCSDCHTNNSNYAVFSCTSCHDHNQTDTDSKHTGIQGYSYSSNACYSCHPKGNSDGSFNHATSVFPLTGAHTTVSCSNCHTNGYAGTPTTCVSCHQTNYNSTSNPSHKTLALSTDCSTCHTTNTGWKPAQFPVHSNYFAFTGAHSTISSNCATCHNGNYTNTSKTCVGCHQSNYNGTTNPSHTAAGFPTDCQSCHTTTGWKPATLDHDGKYFPIYSGSHNGKWSNCSDCHTNNSNYAVFSCTSCHDHNQTDTDSKHTGIQGYSYSSNACYSCHPKGNSDGSFNHATSVFPLTGAHTTVSCSNCHTNGYTGTPTTCVSCHQTNYNSTSNPSHKTLALSTDCSTCHTTKTGWKPAQFPVHSNYFALTGAHAAISSNCATCHNGNYTNTSKTCVGCHQTNYNGTNNPSHTTLGLSTDCTTCHTTSTGWKPAQFPVHSNYFALTGAHAAISSNCATCHNGNYTNTSKTCVGCHQSNYNGTTNPNHITLGISTDCSTCHTTNTGWKPAQFTQHNNYFALTGAHSSLGCLDCHTSGFSGTSSTCIGCHQANYNSTTNPNHKSAGFPTDCQSCHNTNAWQPSTFNHDGQYFPIYSGNHRNRWSLCSDCHTSPSNFAVHSCNTSCHKSDHHQTQDCYTCHPTGNGDTRKLFQTIDK